MRPAKCRLCVAINAANTIVVQTAADGSLSGPAIACAEVIAAQADLPIAYRRYPSAGAIVAATHADEWDIAFIAHDASREDVLYFTAPYLTFPASFAVMGDAGVTRCAELDRRGVAIASVSTAAYDLRLRRFVTAAQIVPCVSTAEALALLRAREVNAAAGIREQLREQVAGDDSLTLVADDFASLDQAVAIRLECRLEAAFLDFVIGRSVGSGPWSRVSQ